MHLDKAKIILDNEGFEYKIIDDMDDVFILQVKSNIRDDWYTYKSNNKWKGASGKIYNCRSFQHFLNIISVPYATLGFIKSRFNVKCIRCNKPIHEDEYIFFQGKGSGSFHLKCSTEEERKNSKSYQLAIRRSINNRR